MSEAQEPTVPISVLIVDDVELLVKSCGQILSREGYTIFTEGRGRRPSGQSVSSISRRSRRGNAENARKAPGMRHTLVQGAGV